MTNPPNQQPDPWSRPESSGHPAPPPDPSHYPPPQPESGYYPGGTPGVYDPMSAPPTYTPPFTSPPPSGGNNNAGMIIGAVIAGVCLIAVIGVVAFLVARPDDDDGTVAEPQDSPSASDGAPQTSGSAGGPPVDPNADIQGDGTYRVGDDIKAGEYSTTVPDSSSLCYWERLKGTSGEFDDIIANGVADPGEKVTVTVKDKDKAFKSQGCGPWTKSLPETAGAAARPARTSRPAARSPRRWRTAATGRCPRRAAARPRRTCP